MILTERFETETLTGYEQKGQVLHLADKHRKVLCCSSDLKKLFTQKLPRFLFRLICIFVLDPRVLLHKALTSHLFTQGREEEGGGGGRIIKRLGARSLRHRQSTPVIL